MPSPHGELYKNQVIMTEQNYHKERHDLSEDSYDLTVDLGPEGPSHRKYETTNLEVLVIYLILSSNIPTSLEKATSFTI